MSINVYDIGDLVTVTGRFLDVNDEPADPSGVSFAFENPAGLVITYVFGTDAALVKASTGVYTVDIDVDAAGDWHYRWISSGAGQGAEPGQFAVKPSHAVA